MPALTRWSIRAALIYLVIALLLGVLQAGSYLWGWNLPDIFPVYIHLFVIGWLTLMIFGVAYWMFPKYSRDKPRRSESLGWAVFALINFGLLLRSFTEPLVGVSSGAFGGWLLAISAVCLWLSGILFVANTWERVKDH
jgi:hypothetical protein